MDKRALEMTVGLFFLMAIAAFVVLALKVSGLGQSLSFAEGYTITANFENIGGLKPRARVTIAGVAVGRVTRIDFDDKDYLAACLIHMDAHVKNIPDDSRAQYINLRFVGG